MLYRGGFVCARLFITHTILAIIMKINQGSYVLLFHTSRKKWLTRVALEKKMHTHLGVIDISSVIGMDYGSVIKTTKGKTIYLIQPTTYDFIMKSERRTQIIYPKDLGFIVARTGLKNGSIVLEVGTGSGALTTFMASIVKPNGHIYTFDVNADFIAVAKRNLEKAGMIEYVSSYQYDLHLGIDIQDVDIAIVDLGDPWTIIKQVYAALKNSGAFAAICPTVNQLEKTAIELKNNDFVDIDCVEIMVRNIEAREGMTRPANRMIAHTTYLIFARKVQQPKKE
jgi:tRNA (adenine57-N1/adenine58-N1)-methyltransferase catalytic subunit